MTLTLALYGFATAFVVTAVATPAVRGFARRQGWVDRPDGGRKAHVGPVPAIGGLAIAMGVVAGMMMLYWLLDSEALGIALPAPAFWIGAAAMLVVGVVDDIKGVGFKSKFAVQLAVAYMLLHAGYRVDVSVLPFVGPEPFDQALFAIPITLLWIVGVINAVNLMDGLDGLAAGVAFICLASLAFVFGIHGHVGLVLIAVLICGALAAFLLFNFNPATIFMGDSGSLVLGYVLAVFALEGRGHVDPAIALLIPVVALGLPLLDTGLSVVRRARSRRSIFAPDRDHIHHRMVQRFAHRRAVMVLWAWAMMFGLAAIMMSFLPAVQALAVIGVLTVLALVALQRLGYHKVAIYEDADLAPLAIEPSRAARIEGDGWAARHGDGHPGEIEPPSLVVPSASGTNEGERVRYPTGS